MTILIIFHTSNYRTFKHVNLFLLTHHRCDFPGLVSYKRFVNLIPRVQMPMFAYLVTRWVGSVNGISFFDSTAIKVCHPRRIGRNRVFDGSAQIGKTTMGCSMGSSSIWSSTNKATCWPSPTHPGAPTTASPSNQ